MKRTSKLTLAITGAIILACSGLEESSDDASTDATPYTDNSNTPPPADATPADLTAPWSGMALPWSGGELIASDETMLLVGWGASSVSSVNSSYSSTMTADGWVSLALIEDAELVVTSYTKGSTSLGMMILSEEGATYAYMEDLSTVEESAFESAKSGEKPSDLPRRKGGKRGKRGKRGKNNR